MQADAEVIIASLYYNNRDGEYAKLTAYARSYVRKDRGTIKFLLGSLVRITNARKLASKKNPKRDNLHANVGR